MTSADIIAELKTEYGADALTAEQWTQAFANGLRLYSKHRPRYVLGSFTTTADVEQYDMPAGGYLCLGVQDIDELSDLDLTDLGITQMDLAEAQGDVIISFHEPSQVNIYRAKLDQWRRQFGSQVEQHVPGGAFRIMPRPTTAKTLAIFYTALHADASTVPDGDHDLLLEACRISVLLIAANIASIAAVGAGGVELQLGPYRRNPKGKAVAAIELRKQAREMETEFAQRATVSAAAAKE